MKRFLNTCAGCLLMHCIAFCQTPAIQWQKCFGGKSYDDASEIQSTLDGGYIIAGSSLSKDGDVTENHGNFDYWIVKVTGTGNIQWQKSFGGKGSDVAKSVQPTLDSGFIVAGYSASNNGSVTGNHGGDDFWIIKLTGRGEIEWQKSLGGTASDQALSVRLTSDGGYIVAGTSASNDGDLTGNHGRDDGWIVKLSSKGDIEWQTNIGGSKDDVVSAIQPLANGGYIAAGFSTSNIIGATKNHGAKDYWVIKLKKSGIVEWQKSFGGSGEEMAYDIKATADSGYIVAGFSGSNNGDVSGNHGDYDCWIVKLNGAGNIQWQKSLGGKGIDVAESIDITKDNGYVVAGYSTSNDGDVSGNHGGYDYWVFKLTDAGDILWQKCFGGTDKDMAQYIQMTKDGSYIIAGESSSNNGDLNAVHGVHTIDPNANFNYSTSDYWIVKLSGL